MPIVTDEGDDAVVTAWMVDELARVAPGQLIAEVQAEKVAMDVEAPVGGIVSGLVAINEPVAQGEPICVIEEAAGRDSEPPSEAQGEASAPRTGDGAPPRVPASPAARRLARDLGVDVARLTGSGPGGRITEADVRSAAPSEPPEPAPPTGLRTVIARNMRASHASTAPVTLTTTADVTGRVPERITAWVVRATANALSAHPDLDGVRDGDVFRPAETTGISVAVQTDAGLVAPVVVDPASKSLTDLAEEIATLAARARARELENADFQGGTFSVTNLGAYGVDAFTPIINLPEIAILGVGAIRDSVALEEDRPTRRRTMTLSLTFDHAFVDGAPAAACLATIRRELETGSSE